MSGSETVAGPAPMVSVILPVYRAEGTLERAVRSVLRQTVPDLEVLVLDDGSTDGTRAVAEALAGQDPRVRVLPSEQNLGVGATRNRGLDAARGTWVALLDADDAWLPTRLEHMLAASSDVDIVGDDLLLLDATRLAGGQVAGVRVLPWRGLRLSEPRLVRLEEFVEHDLGYLKPMLRRRSLEACGLRYWPQLRVAGDFAFAVVALGSGLTWRQLPTAHYCYLRGDPSLSSGPTAVSEAHVAMLPDLLAVPGIAASPSAVRALRRHTRRARAALAYHEVRSLVRQRRLPRVAGLAVRSPEVVPLLTAKTARRLRLAALRRLLGADRLPRASVEAVREVPGLVGPPA